MPSTLPSTISSSELCNILDPKGNSMAHLAAATGNLDCLRLLCSKCKDLLSQCNDLDQTVVEVAVVNGRAKCLKWLLTKTLASSELYPSEEHKRCLLHLACEVGHLNCLYTILTLMQVEDMNLECIDGDGNTPAHLAAKNGHLGCLQTLAEFNIDVTMENNSGKTPCNFADESGHYHCVNYLIVVESCMQLASDVALASNEVRHLQEENASLKGYLEECLKINNVLLNQQQHKESHRKNRELNSDVKSLVTDIVSQLQGLLIDHRNLLEKAEKGVSKNEMQHERFNEVLVRAEEITEKLQTPRKSSSIDEQGQPTDSSEIDEGARRLKELEEEIRQMSRQPSPVTTEYSETKDFMRRKFHEVSHRLMVFHTAFKERQPNKIPLSVCTPPQTPQKPSEMSPRQLLPTKSLMSDYPVQNLGIKRVAVADENISDEEMRKLRLNQAIGLKESRRHNGVVETVSGANHQRSTSLQNAREFAIVVSGGPKRLMQSNGINGNNRDSYSSSSSGFVTPRTPNGNHRVGSDTNSSMDSTENRFKTEDSFDIHAIVAKFEAEGTILMPRPPQLNSCKIGFRNNNSLPRNGITGSDNKVQTSPSNERAPKLVNGTNDSGDDLMKKIAEITTSNGDDDSGYGPGYKPSQLKPKTLFPEKEIIKPYESVPKKLNKPPSPKPLSPKPPSPFNPLDVIKQNTPNNISDSTTRNDLLALPTGDSVVSYLNKVNPRTMTGTGPMIKLINNQKQRQTPTTLKMLSKTPNGTVCHHNAMSKSTATTPPIYPVKSSTVSNKQQQENSKQCNIQSPPIALNNNLPPSVLDNYADNVSMGEDSVFEGSTASGKSWYECSSDEGC